MVDFRSPVARLGALVAALLVVVGGVDRAYAAAHCPHHGAPPAESTAPHRHTVPAPEPSPGDAAHGHCTCIGACAPGAAFALTARAGAALPMPPASRPSAPAPAPTVDLARRDHQLPFATAPPTDR